VASRFPPILISLHFSREIRWCGGEELSRRGDEGGLKMKGSFFPPFPPLFPCSMGKGDGTTDDGIGKRRGRGILHFLHRLSCESGVAFLYFFLAFPPPHICPFDLMLARHRVTGRGKE